VFKLTPGPSGYTESILYRFLGHAYDGAGPVAGLIAEKGALYGTTSGGGSSACSGGCGTVFRIVP
jgi:uncharacterized repeat protein (TIGR03803 family)